jgi:F-type H+-transporting ATPase subunit gamma
MEKLLPMEPAEVVGEAAAYAADYIFEPDRARLLASLLPKTVSFRIYYALLQNAAGEHGARMTAMDNATTNAGNLIDRYTLMRNRARQAEITTELTEIVSGAEAL